MRKYALWFFRQMSAVRGRLLLRIIAGLLQVALGLWLVWLCRRFIDVVIWRGDVLRETIVLFFCHRSIDSPSPAGILSFRHHRGYPPE